MRKIILPSTATVLHLTWGITGCHSRFLYDAIFVVVILWLATLVLSRYEHHLFFRVFRSPQYYRRTL